MVHADFRPGSTSGLERQLAGLTALVEQLIDTISGTSVLVFDVRLRVRLTGGGRWAGTDSAVRRSEGRPLEDLFSGSVVQRVTPEYQAVLAGEERTFTLSVGHAIRWVTARPIRDEDGEVVGGLAFSWDGSAARESERRYRLLAENATDIVSCYDGEGRLIWVSPSVETLLGWHADELLGTSALTYVHPDDVEAAQGSFLAILSDGQDRHWRFRMRARDGGYRWLDISARMVRDAVGERPMEVHCSSRDVTARHLAEVELASRLDQQSAVARLGRMALEHPDLGSLHQEACRVVADTLDVELVYALEHRSGSTLRVRAGVGWPDGFVGSDFEMRSFGGEHPGAHYADGAVVIDDLRHSPLRAAPLRAAGVRSAASVLVGTRERPWGLLGAHTRELRAFSEHDLDFLASIAHVLAAATDRADIEERIRRDALHDALTGLPNRALLLERLRTAHQRCSRTGNRIGVLFLDVDNFKVVNDSLGHDAGDDLLRALGRRLEGALRPGDTVARLGGDEFVVLLDDLRDHTEAEAIAQRMLGELREPLHVGGDRRFISASIGVAVLDPASDRDVQELIGDADAAMYRAKRHGRGRLELFDQSLRTQAIERISLEADLRRSLEATDGALWVAYQPYWDIASRTIVGFEALARFDRTGHGPVSPGEFIPVAEDSGLIGELGARTLRVACAQLAAWRRLPGGDELQLTVNISARQVTDPGLVDLVEAALRVTGLPPASLGLEITEGLLLDETPGTVGTLRSIKSLGVRLILDDFGTGYSSLNYLQRFALDGLKIDRSFIAALGPQGDGDAAIVAAIIGMARALDLHLIPEGIETEAQLERIAELGCDLAQGFLLARPLAPDDATRLLRSMQQRVPPAPASRRTAR